MGDAMIARARVKICTSGRDSWKVAEETDPTEHVHELDVDLEIQGNKSSGYHLVMSPDGCFTADTWHESKEDALETASAMFGVAVGNWQAK